jgi:flagella basal body P-ring formation protein FlgA
MTLGKILGLAIFFGIVGTVVADDAVPSRTIKIIGRKTVTLTTANIRLGDLAEISSSQGADDNAVIGLQKIFIEKSPLPGNDATISAATILEKLGSQGVDLTKVSYSFPRIIGVKRAARAVTRDEVKAAIEAALSLSGIDAALKDVRYNEDHFITPGNTKIDAIPLNSTTAGSRPFTMKISVDGETQQAFQVDANVDEWGMMPVAKRSVNRGNLIHSDDVVMARVNLASLPRDVIRQDRDIVGLEASRDISFGEYFRRDKLSIPPVVTAGSKVTMLYKNGFFEASATGIALESGIRGQEIHVRNDVSKKVISATALEPGLVGVKP